MPLIVNSGGAYELFFEQADSALEWWKAIFIFVLGLAFVIASLVGFFLVKKRIALGFNHNGLYVRSYGVVPWSQIKSFEIGKFGFGNSRQECIFVSLHDPESFFSMTPLSWKCANRRMTKDRVLIVGRSVSMSLKKLLPFLQTYHQDVLQS